MKPNQCDAGPDSSSPPSNVFAVTEKTLNAAAERLQEDELIGMPTETVYGLAGNGFSTTSLAKIFEVKNRPLFDPLILHTNSAEAAFRLGKEVSPLAEKAAEHFWPGPLTLVLNKNDKVPDLATSGSPSVAVRVPRHPIAHALLDRLSFPLAAPSANKFGRISPTSAQAVYAELGLLVAMILDGGACEVGVESTVLDVRGDRPRILRPGGISLEELENVLGPVELPNSKTRVDSTASPGLLNSHYAPKKPMRLVASIQDIPREKRVGWLAFGATRTTTPDSTFPGIMINVSLESDLRIAAAHFFQALRALDDHPLVSTIYALSFPEVGLGRALNDRLKRASWTTQSL